MDDLPPDLSRLGHDLTAAVDRSLRRDRLRRRLVNRAATVGMSGALIFVAMTPALLQPANMAIEERRRILLAPDDTDTVARRCESPERNSVPICDDAPQVFVASAAGAAHERTRAGELVTLGQPNAPRRARTRLPVLSPRPR